MLLLQATRTVLTRACQALLVGVVALLMTLIALGNVMNYDSNLPFVRHVLAMDTIFPASHLTWRAITNPGIQAVAYLGIIVWEALCAVITGIAAVALLVGTRSTKTYRTFVPIALTGITMVMLLFGAGFLVIGGEWFLMWQSTTWNGTEPATRYFTVAGITLLIVLRPSENEEH